MEGMADDILRRASRGDAEAFEKIYRFFSGFVYNVAYRITNNREDAQEAVQDVFLKIYDNLGGFRFRSSIKTWIYRITVNAAINIARKRTRDMNRRADYDKVVKTKEAPDETAHAIDREDNEALLEYMLKRLNPDQRACVVLRDIKGLSYKEISEVLNININTVRTRLKRGREALLGLRQKGVVENGL
jgi:RNA polymerase sigma-70 factor (ECF subfamily)